MEVQMLALGNVTAVILILRQPLGWLASKDYSAYKITIRFHSLKTFRFYNPRINASVKGVN